MPVKPGKETNIFLAMPPNRSSAWISAYIAKSLGYGGVYLTFAKAFSKLDNYYEQLLSQKEDIDRGVGTELAWGRKENKIYISVPHVPFTNLDDPAEREHVIAYLADMTNRMVNVFRHRLEAISREID